MRLIRLFILLLTATGIAAQRTPKAVFVIADGIPADIIMKLPMSNLHAMSREGGFVKAHVGGEKDTYTQTPTISAVGYNSLLTGTWVNKHNVWDNDIVAPNYHYWSIFRFLKTSFPEKKTAVFSTWLDNRTKLVGSDAKNADNLQPDYYFDGMELDTIHYAHDTAGFFYHVIDEAVIDTASAVIKRKGPDLTWVYLEYTDEMGHRHGNGKYMNDAIAMVDKQIGKLWAALQYRQQHYNEQWQIYVTTDHGRETNGYGHGGQSLSERTTWIATNAHNLNTYFFNGNPGIIDIMPSIASFLKIPISREALMEIDGVSLTGPISATNLEAVRDRNTIKLKWTVQNKRGVAKIWLTTTNNFKNGGKDEYKLVKTVPVAKGGAIIDLKGRESDFYKVVLEMPHNFLNRWLINN